MHQRWNFSLFTVKQKETSYIKTEKVYQQSQTLEPFLKTINVGIACISYFAAISWKIVSSALKNSNSNTTEQAYNESISND